MNGVYKLLFIISAGLCFLYCLLDVLRQTTSNVIREESHKKNEHGIIINSKKKSILNETIFSKSPYVIDLDVDYKLKELFSFNEASITKHQIILVYDGTNELSKKVMGHFIMAATYVTSMEWIRIDMNDAPSLLLSNAYLNVTHVPVIFGKKFLQQNYKIIPFQGIIDYKELLKWVHTTMT